MNRQDQIALLKRLLHYVDTKTTIVQAHGGTLQLTNRQTGGLRATIVLPT